MPGRGSVSGQVSKQPLFEKSGAKTFLFWSRDFDTPVVSAFGL
jgi:hypothetical protein